MRCQYCAGRPHLTEHEANTGSAELQISRPQVRKPSLTATVDRIAVLEELGGQLVEARLRALLHVTSRLLGELAPEPRHDRVGSVVGAPLAQQPTPAQTGAAARVEGHAVCSIEADRRRQLCAPWPANVGGALAYLGQQVTEALLDCWALQLSWVSPLVTSREKGAVIDDHRRVELARVIIGPRKAPWDLLVAHGNPLPQVQGVPTAFPPRVLVRRHARRERAEFLYAEHTLLALRIAMLAHLEARDKCLEHGHVEGHAVHVGDGEHVQ
eukprot:scaffold26043_cov61-Phaeocystis_antarctica.AAC.2